MPNHTFKELTVPGRTLGKSEYVRNLLANYPGKAHHMTATEVKLNEQVAAANMAVIAKQFKRAFTDQMARSIDQEVFAGLTGINTAQQGQAYNGGFPFPYPVMVEPLSTAEQEVMATFHICPQCNEEVDYVHQMSESTLSNTGRGWACERCAYYLRRMQSEEQKARMEQEYAQMRKMQDLMAPMLDITPENLKAWRKPW